MAKVDDSVIVYEFADGWYVVELLTHYDYLREGGLMGNCVAKYFDSEDTVYSLRSDRYEPHASMLYRGKMMIEICGRFNSSLKAEYRLRVEQFMRDCYFPMHPLAYDITDMRRQTQWVTVSR